ncbi:Intermediate cleaving peptidase 55 [Wickerhamiella sorbophila]|uniref:Intermediate cleaving peptidase 55 n=1 Tax=Wickerhamiella sorbophila TaxID=45607 RepID=A0A2T0FPM2_9ASCO|nr:Intermediate cleaving peptidase 55 [Wickerhamiella sorbophila]PRT56936.1 Intermediate cleaving peptidase 55 [Wickerhamiella sorbophila]
MSQVRARALGQAFAENRPHLVQKGHLTPLIPPSEFADRRAKVLQHMKPSSLAIVPGNVVQFASPSVFHPFRQDPTMQYLTGFLESDACLLLHKGSDSSIAEEILLVNEKDTWAEKWEGDRTGTELIPELLGIETALPNSKLRQTVTSLLGSVSTVYADLSPKATVRAGPFFHHELPALAHNSKASVRELSDLVNPLRAIKSENEIDAMRMAAEISAIGYNRAFRQEFYSEHQLHAFLDFMFRNSGGESDAYLAVVAGGAHALTIHYVRNDDVLQPGDLVLVDAGARYGGYCADISRTWPVNGKFSGPQRDLYEAVLNVNKACIERCTVSSGMSLHDIHRFSEKQMQIELANAGLELPRSLVSVAYPHSIGHHLGLDVHDVSVQGQLEANNVITIEPGVYIPFDDRFPKAYQGIGIRIEDNIVVGITGYENLTIDTLKEVEEVQR